MATDIESDALDADAARLTEAIVEAVRPALRDLAARALEASFRRGARHALRPLQAALAALEEDGADGAASVQDTPSDAPVRPAPAADVQGGAQPRTASAAPASASDAPARRASVPGVAARARSRTDARQIRADALDVPVSASGAPAQPASAPAGPARADATIRELALEFVGNHPDGATAATVAAHCRARGHRVATDTVRKALGRLGEKGAVRCDNHLWRAVAPAVQAA